MKYILPLLLVVITACNKPGVPTDQQIESAVKELYLHQQEASGAGGWTITGINILRKEPGDDKRHYNVTVEVSGMHKAPPLANPVPDEPFTEKKQLIMMWRGGRWMDEGPYDK